MHALEPKLKPTASTHSDTMRTCALSLELGKSALVMVCVTGNGLGGRAMVHLSITVPQAACKHGSCVRSNGPRGYSSGQAVWNYGGQVGGCPYKRLGGGEHLASPCHSHRHQPLSCLA